MVRGPDGARTIESYGHTIIKPIYEDVGDLRFDLCAVRRDGLWGYLDKYRC